MQGRATDDVGERLPYLVARLARGRGPGFGSGPSCFLSAIREVIVAAATSAETFGERRFPFANGCRLSPNRDSPEPSETGGEVAQTGCSFYNNRSIAIPVICLLSARKDAMAIAQERRKHMKLSKFGRISMALVASLAVGLGMTACGGGTIGFMWVGGTQYNQIAGFKIDDYTGNLTAVPNSPFSASGTNPRMIVVKPGGRYLYVINAGGSGATGLTGQNVAEFSVGGDGILTFQQLFTSQGQTPVWAAIDSSGNFLYVLDSLAPAGVIDATSTTSPQQTYAQEGRGDITVFAIDPNTGRLSLVTNNQIKNANNINLNFFPVGVAPTMTKTGGGSCLYTLDSGTNSIFPYSINSGNGQLTQTTNSEIVTGAGRLTSINSTGSYIYLTDSAATAASPGGQILPYTPGTNCSLNTLTGGGVNNLPLTSNPVWTLTDNRGRFLYVVNQSTTNSNNANSTISAFSIDSSTGKLQQIPDSNNPYPTGSGAVCMAEDPTNQWVYTSNTVDGTITGKAINQNTGQLSDLPRGSKFTATGLATCLVISGSVY